MKYTQNLNMKIPEGGDPIDIADITGNFETLDEEVNKKASSSGGDISNTTIKTVDTIADSFPVPSAGESSKTFLGKVKKALQDMKDFSTGVVTLGRLVNNGQTTESGFALDARYGKTLYDLYAQLNSNLDNTKSKLYTELSSGVDGRTIFPSEFGQTMYRCTTSNHAPKASDEAYIIVVYRDWDFIVQVWYSLWYDVVYYNRCDISNNWTWSGFKKQGMTPV